MAGSRTVNVGMIGYGFMGKAHSLGYRDVSVIAPAEVPRPRVKPSAARDPTALTEAKERYGWEAAADWRDLVADPDIELVDNTGPNSLHIEPISPRPRRASTSIARSRSARRGGDHSAPGRRRSGRRPPHVRLQLPLLPRPPICPQPDPGRRTRDDPSLPVAVPAGGFARRYGQDLARRMIGAGSGALGDLGSHHIDMSRFLLGRNHCAPPGFSASCSRRPRGRNLETDERFAALLEYGNEPWRVRGVASGRRPPRHQPHRGRRLEGVAAILDAAAERAARGGPRHGFKTIPVLRSGDPYQPHWFPAGHPLGWVDMFSHEAMHMLGAIGGLHTIGPIGATFEDGYRCAEIVDAIARSSAERRGVDIAYRSVSATADRS